MSDEVLQERVTHIYPCTVSVKHTASGDEITVHHATSPQQAAELIRLTKEQIKIKEQYRR